MDPYWKIDELARVVEAALQRGPQEPRQSARVRSVPDRRTIRYYTTLGLLDKPAEMRGRTAYYGRRHAMQLVVIKRLQSRGLSLAEVQRTLVGVDDRKLAQWADVPDDFWPNAMAAERASRPSPDTLLGAPGDSRQRAAERFWAAAPRVSRGEPCVPTAEPPEGGAPRLALHLPVLRGVELVIEGFDPGRVNDPSLQQLQPALEGLRAALRRAGLVADEHASPHGNPGRNAPPGESDPGEEPNRTHEESR